MPLPAVLGRPLRAAGLRLTDETSIAYALAQRLAATILAPNCRADAAALVDEAIRYVAIVAEYEHGSADWPCDPATYCEVIDDVFTCHAYGG